MSDIVDISEARAARRKGDVAVAQDGSQWTVLDMLEDAVKDAKEGPRKMVKGVFVYLFDQPDGTQRIGWSQANLTRAEQVGFLSLAVKSSIDDWLT